ncbi:hypothetical protein MSAN_02367000 [Mycena sanguinolenta]|uniref:Uncharacterized protein n=1 Tax=Mycena sanguinolenta TaxID=230812 RepID=A0A8H6X6C0_9AGAR|nr:hypothetical protein MSAN_02367000 [Mycena sanguinolenta]
MVHRAAAGWDCVIGSTRSFKTQTWEHILHLPDAPVDDFNRELAGFSRLLDSFSAPKDQNFPFIDFSTLPTNTPKPRRALTTMEPPPTPLPSSRLALQDFNSFTPYGIDNSLRLPPLHSPSLPGNMDGLFNSDEAKRAFLAKRGSEKKPVGRPRKQKENADTSTTPSDSTSNRAQYTGDDLIAIARVVVDVNPFIAAYGQKGAAWQQICDKLTENGFRHKSINAATVQHKAEALISYKKDPNGKNKNLSKVIGEGTSAAITIAALLECIETQYDESKDKSDEAKAKLKAKQDADREGGEAIRQASMQTLRKRMRSPSPDTDDDDDDDDEPTDTEQPAAPSTTATGTARSPDVTAATGTARSPDATSTPTASTQAASSSSSLETIDSDVEDNAKANKKKSKRRRTMDRRTSSGGHEAIAALLKEENTRRAAHDDRMATTFETFVKDAREQKEQMTSFLKDLVTLAKAEL